MNSSKMQGKVKTQLKLTYTRTLSFPAQVEDLKRSKIKSMMSHEEQKKKK
jgi:hypothetical protein